MNLCLHRVVHGLFKLYVVRRGEGGEGGGLLFGNVVDERYFVIQKVK